VVVVVMRDEDPLHVFRVYQGEYVVQPGFPVADQARVDDDRLLTEDDGGVDVGEKRSFAFAADLADDVSVIADLLRLVVEPRWAWCKGAHVDFGAAAVDGHSHCRVSLLLFSAAWWLPVLITD
jgi:hypothetical protein